MNDEGGVYVGVMPVVGTARFLRGVPRCPVLVPNNKRRSVLVRDMGAHLQGEGSILYGRPSCGWPCGVQLASSNFLAHGADRDVPGRCPASMP